MAFKVPQFIAMLPDANGAPIGGGYKCTVCGLEGLTNGEPHISSAGRVCYAAAPGVPILASAGPGGMVTRVSAPIHTPAAVSAPIPETAAVADAKKAKVA